MKKEHRHSSTIETELKGKISELAILRNKFGRAEKQIAEWRKRISELAGYGYNEIKRLEDELASSRRHEEDSTAMTVHWAEEGYQTGSTRYVVSRITPKCIFVRMEGYERCDTYQLDGTSKAYRSKIDMLKTFGKAELTQEDVKAFKKKEKTC